MIRALGRFLRYGIFATLALVLVALVVLSYLVLTFEPNQYREELVSLVEEHTGRAFAIEGDLELHLNLPLVGFEMHGATLDNAVGFGQEPMLVVKRTEVYLQVMPLLRGDLRLHSVNLDGVHLRLHRKANSHDNWSQLLAGTRPPAADAPEAQAETLPKLDLQSVQMTDATIAFWDGLHKQRWRLLNLNLKATPTLLGDAVRMEASTEIMAWPGLKDNLRVNAQTQIAAELALDPRRVAAEDLHVNLELGGPAFDFERLKLVGEAQELQWDVPAGVMRVGEAQVSAEGAQLRVPALTVKNLHTHPEAHGSLHAADVDVRRWAQALNMHIPESADATVLRKLHWRSDLAVHSHGVEVSALEAVLDDTPIRGELSILDFDRPRIALALQVGAMDLDRYLMPPIETGGSAQTPQESREGDLPIEWLRRQRVNAQVDFEYLTVQKLTVEQAQLGLSAHQGRWTLETRDGRVNGGLLAGRAQLDVSGGIPAYQLEMDLDDMEIGPFLALVGSGEQVPLSGTAELDLAMTARGQRATAFWSSLNGEIGLSMRNGTLHVGSVVQAVEHAVAVLQNRESQTTLDGRLLFDLLRANWHATDGRLINRDLLLRAGAIEVEGQGHIDLPQSTLDYQLSVASGDSVKIPLRISGPFDNLSHSMDLSALIKGQIKDVPELIEDAVEGAVEKPVEILRKLTDGLF